MKKLIPILLLSATQLKAIDPTFLTIRLTSTTPDVQITLKAVASDSNQLLEGSTNLVNWLVIAPLDLGTNEFLLVNPIDPQVFFRIHERGATMQAVVQPMFKQVSKAPTKVDLEFRASQEILIEIEREIHKGDAMYPPLPPTGLTK